VQLLLHFLAWPTLQVTQNDWHTVFLRQPNQLFVEYRFPFLQGLGPRKRMRHLVHLHFLLAAAVLLRLGF
jgi:hypothetical protein